jgi:hypothetical protein
MSRRTSLPGADELFRSTGAAPAAVPAAPPAGSRRWPTRSSRTPGDRPAAPRPRCGAHPRHGVRGARAVPVDRRPDRPRAARGEDHRLRVADELLDLEHARLTLRGDHGLAVDRGRIVREALAVVLADLDAKGETSILVRRLRGL